MVFPSSFSEWRLWCSEWQSQDLNLGLCLQPQAPLSSTAAVHHGNEKPSSPEVFLLDLTEPRLGEGFISFLPFSMCNNIKAISFCIKELLKETKPLQLQLNSSYSTKKKKKWCWNKISMPRLRSLEEMERKLHNLKPQHRGGFLLMF